MVLEYKGHSEVCPNQWARIHFSGAELGYATRVSRLIKIATAMAMFPGKSIPALFDKWYGVKATYRLVSREGVTAEGVQMGHRKWVLAAIRKPGKVLLIGDTSQFCWSGKKPIKGLGPIGTGSDGLQGFLLHSVLAVRWPEEAVGQVEGEVSTRRPPVEVLGLVDQQYCVREERPEGEASGDSKARKARDRESQLWQTSVQRIGPAPEDPGTVWINVDDRGADIYEYMSECVRSLHSFVIRACQDRVIQDPKTSEPSSRLFESVRKCPVQGKFELDLRARPGQPARKATLSVCSLTGVYLRSPQRPGHAAGCLPPILCNVVRVFEENPPRGVDPLEWILLTDQPVETFEQALECALIYATRWLIEEFHKALKTGCGAEKLQLKTFQRLSACISILSVIALRLIHIKESFRIKPEAPAKESGLDPFELDILRARLKRPIHTVREVALAIGRLGGHLNRKGDGMPGMITLWRGFSELRLLVRGAKIALNAIKSG